MAENPTAPLSQTALLRVDQATGTVKERRFVLTVLSGPEQGKSFPLEGTAFVGTHPQSDIPLTDPTVSRYHLEVQVTPAGVRIKDAGSTNGTFLLGNRIESAVIEQQAVLKVGSTRVEIALAERDLGIALSDKTRFGKAIGQSVRMRELFGLLERAAGRDLSVLLLGETGTGKELIAEGLHTESKRRDKPFVVVDCSAIAAELVESELFGHVKGAFTGAVSDRLGAFLQADGGTIFLDEVGELPLNLQPKLLRALEAQTIKRVGEDKTRRINVRVVAATHRNLSEEVEAGRYRRDLFYRLAVVIAWVPPLRERLEDLPLLVNHFVEQQGGGDFTVSAALLDQLRGHDWPGNVRELRNVVQRAMAGVSIDVEGARRPPPLSEPAEPAGPPAMPATRRDLPFHEAKDQLIEAFTKDYLTALLARCDGNLSAAARTAGLNRNYVRRLLVRYGLRATEEPGSS